MKKTVDAYRSTPAYLAREEKRRALFDPTALLTEETLARQLRFIREAYGLTLRNEQLSLQRLARTDFRQAVLSGSLEILSVLAQCFGGIKNRSAGKFAERYCSCYMPVYYPVCDRDTAAGLRYYRDGCGFYPFLDEDLENPRKFRRVLLLFRQKYALTGVTNADAAEYLACIGQNTVDIKEAHS